MITPAVGATLVLDDHGSVVLVQAERVDASPVHGTGAVLARQEPHAQHRLHVPLDEALHIRLDISKTRRDLRHTAICRVEQLQARHLPLLGSEIDNAGRLQDCFRQGLRCRGESVRAYVRPDRGALASLGHQGSTIPFPRLFHALPSPY